MSGGSTAMLWAGVMQGSRGLFQLRSWLRRQARRTIATCRPECVLQVKGETVMTFMVSGVSMCHDRWRPMRPDESALLLRFNHHQRFLSRRHDRWSASTAWLAGRCCFGHCLGLP